MVILLIDENLRMKQAIIDSAFVILTFISEKNYSIPSAFISKEPNPNYFLIKLTIREIFLKFTFGLLF